MRMYQQLLMRGIFATLLLAGGASAVFAQAAAGGGGTPGGPGGEMRGPTRLQGHLVCTDCGVDEVRTAHPEIKTQSLYEFTHGSDQAVFQIDRVNEAERWDDLTLDKKRLQIRGDERYWQALTAPANRAKEVELTGLLENTGTLDISGVSFAAAAVPPVGDGVRQERR
jgi:hypothetical protein